MPGNAMALDEVDEIAGCIAGKRGLAEMRILRQEILRARMDVGEVAPPAARDADLFARRLGMIEDHDAAPAFARFDRTHHAGSTGTDDHYVLPVCQNPLPFSLSFRQQHRKSIPTLSLRSEIQPVRGGNRGFSP